MKKIFVFAAVLQIAWLGQTELVWSNHRHGTVLVGDPTPGDDGPPPFNCGAASNPCDTIQNGIDHAGRGQKVLVRAGVYVEQVVIDKSLKLIAAAVGGTIIVAPGSLDPETDGDGTAIVEITGNLVNPTVHGFTIEGPLATVTSAIHVHDGANATISNNTVVGTDPLSDSLIGQGITVGSSLDGDEDAPGTAKITNNRVSGFHRAGIAVMGLGSNATINFNIVTGGGATASTTQQGITVQDGASAIIVGNAIRNLGFTGASPQTAVGIFLFDSVSDIRISNNAILDAQTGILLQGTDGTLIWRNDIVDGPGGVAVARGIWLLGRGSTNTACDGGDGVTPGLGCSTSATITENVLDGNGEGSGVVIGKPDDVAFTPAPSSAVMTGNTLGGWASSVDVFTTGSCLGTDCP